MIEITEEIIENIDHQQVGFQKIEFDMENPNKNDVLVVTVELFIEDDRKYSFDNDNPPELIEGALDVFIHDVIIENMDGEIQDCEYDDDLIWKHFRNIQ